MPTTTHYGVNLPTVGADADAWGDENNTAHQAWDTLLFGKLDKAGGTLTGLLGIENYALDADQVTPAANAATINQASGNANFFHATISGAVALTFSNPPASGTAYEFTLELTNGGAGTQAWPASVKWMDNGGAAPALRASGVDVLTFDTRDGGAMYRGWHAGSAAS